MAHRLRFVLAALVAGGLIVPLAAQTSLPSAPQNVRGSVAGTQVTLAWDPPATGTPIFYYMLDLGTQPGVYAASVPVGPIATLSFDGDIGATYYSRVSAVNFLGAGAPSAEVSVTVAAATQLPSAPLNPSITYDRVATKLTLSWSPPAVGAPVTDYIFYLGLAPGDYSGYAARTGRATSYTFNTTLSSGTYYFHVLAENAVGQGPFSVDAGIDIASPTPSAPQNMAATAVGSTVTVTWNPPALGAPFVSYGLEYGIQPGVYLGSIDVRSATSFTASGVPDGGYYFRVTSANAFGRGTPSTEVRVTVGVPTELPSVPQDLKAVYANGRTTYSWSPPARGAPVSDYIIEIAITPGDYIYGARTAGGTSMSFPMSNGATYYYRVKAENALGQGPPSLEYGFTVGGSLASAPRNLTATATGPGLTVSWQPPVFGAPIVDYVMEYALQPGVYVGAIHVGTATSFFAPTVPPGILYFRVSAINAFGQGTPSNEVSLYTGPPCTVPSAPQLSGWATGNQVSLSWTIPSGGPLTNYTLDVALVANGPTVATLDMGLLNAFGGQASGGEFYLRVAAHALCGAGPRSNEIAVTVP